MKKPKKKISIILEFGNDTLPNTEDKRELEYSLLTILKEALNEDRLIVSETDIKSNSEIEFKTVII